MSITRLLGDVGFVSRATVFWKTTPHKILASRSLHGTTVARKAKKTPRNNGEDEDAFAIEEEQELFTTSTDTRSAIETKTPTSQLRKTSDSPIADDTVRRKHAKAKDPPRRAILARMIAQASTRAELLEIVNAFSIFREKKWPIDELNRIDFIGRCISLKTPDIALAVLYHRPQFGIDIPTLSTGRALLHSLIYAPYPPPNTPLPDHLSLPTSTPFTHALLLSNLFDVYALPPVESDEVTRALLLGACANYENKDMQAEDVGTITQRIRQWTDSQQATKEAGTEISAQGTKSEKLVRSVKAVKERGKTSVEKKIAPVASAKLIPPERIPLYSNDLTAPERKWIRAGLDSFIEWAQEKGEEVAWVEKLRVQTT
ncbi:hypothetical protein FRC07_011081 [Ceratobasidium sp. 392]|nr:hypothetical protein FRC07_011081 [Ceratobasidium sp. 392]